MDSAQLARYLAGEATASERASVEAWAGSDPANARLLTQLGTGWARTTPTTDWNVERAWTRVQIKLREPRPDPVIRPLPARRPALVWLAAAAVVILGVGILRWWPRPGPAGAEYATAVAERRTIWLPDSSEVVLAPDSKLSVPGGFGRSARDVRLAGHAWFSVRHDATRPFRVSTSTAVIEDVGTEFAVEAHGAEVQVAVMSGAVLVRSRETPAAPAVRLGPRDVAVVGATAAPQVSHEVEVERIAGWRQGRLAFDGRTARDILAELERWYPVRFAVPDSSLADKHLFVTVPTADLQEAVEVIVGALGASASQVGATITLAPKGGR